MKRLFLIIALILLANITLGATTNDFVKIETNGITYFTHKNLIDGNYIVGSDKIFYGSKNGNVKLKIFLSEKEAIGTKNFRVGVRSHGSLIKITEVSVDGSTTIIQNPIFEQNFIFQPFINIGKDIEEIEIELEFDPLDVGTREEIDIVLYNQFGTIVAVYDPFISGFGFRQKLTLNTNGITLSGDITRDHTILVYLSPSNSDFWAGDTLGTGNGITFAQSDETTELDFDIEEFNDADNNAWFWFEETETFTSATDIEAWFYYGGADVDNSDGAGAYPTDYNAVFHLNENSAYQDAKGNHNETGSSVTRNTTCLISKCASFNGSNQFVDFGTSLGNFSTNEFSYTARISQNTTSINQHFMGKRDIVGDTQWSRLFYSGSLKLVIELGVGAVASSANMDTEEWITIAGTRGNSSNFQVYINGASAGSAGSNNEDVDNSSNFTIGATDDLLNDFEGLIDEVRIYNYALSADEIKLLHNSEIDNLITFGAEEVGVSTLPDINVVTPSETGIQIKGGDVFVIDFNVSDPDSNSLLIDLNFSTSNTQGTGTVIINDENTTGGLITCADSDFSDSTNCTFSWTTPTSDANFFVLALASDGVNTSFDAGDNNFMIDSTAPTFGTIFPDVNFTKTNFNLDFNTTISDGVGSGNFRCITRVFFDGVLQGGLDLNVNGSAGTCSRSLSSGVPNDTNVSVGFSSVDNVGNVSTEVVSQLIFFSPPEVTPIVTVNFPNGGETFDNRLVETIDINFTIADSDSTTWLIDINFSTQVSQGTGTIITTDLNILDAGIVCTTPPTGAECIFSWDIDLVADNDYFINILVTDDQGLSAFDGSDSTFEIFTTSFPSQTQDENYVRYIPPEDPRLVTTIIQQPELIDDPLLKFMIVIIAALIILILIFAVFRRGK